MPVYGADEGPLDYYKNEFIKEKKKSHLADTLFEKTVWHKKISHIVIEEKKEFYYVTLLMIMPYPGNYKSQNYALHYKFKNFDVAFNKMQWLNKFLKDDGVLRVKILGSIIVSEKILYSKENTK